MIMRLTKSGEKTAKWLLKDCIMALMELTSRDQLAEALGKICEIRDAPELKRRKWKRS